MRNIFGFLFGRNLFKSSMIFCLFLILGRVAHADVNISCIFQDCLRHGWQIYDERTGNSSLVSCRFGDCAENGWTEEYQNRVISQSDCKVGGCFNGGWRMVDSNTGRLLADVSCLNSFASSDCLQSGWTTFEPGRGSYTTRCVRGDCRNFGWDVLVQGFAPQPVRCKNGGCFLIGWLIYR